MSVSSRCNHFGLVAVITAAATLSAVCLGGVGSGASAGAATSHSGGSLTFALESESPGYVPGISSMLSYSGGAVEAAVYDPLTRYAANGKAEPDLAKTVVANSTDTQWTVTLQPGVRFDDGSVATPQDIVDDYTEYYNAAGSAAAATFAEVKSVSATATSAVFTLDAPDANFPVLLTTFFVFNPDIKAKYGADFSAHPDGTGPFEFVSWTQNDEIVLKRNPYYWKKSASGQQLPLLNNLTLKIIVSGATRNDSLESGGIDGYQSIEAPVLAAAQKLPHTKVLLGETGGLGWFLNTAAAPTNNDLVREALAYATDRAAILASQGGGSILSLRDQYYGPTSPYYSAAAASKYPNYDPAKAKSILKKYNKAIGQPAGTPVPITLSYLSGDPASGAAVLIAQQDWDAAGFKVTLQDYSEATLIVDALEGKTEAFWFGWGSNVPYALFNHNYLAPTEDPENWTKLNDPTVESTISTLATCTTLACTKAGAATIAEQFDTQLPVLFLMSSEEGWAIDTSKVGGYQLDPAASIGLDPEIQWDTLYAK